MKLQRKDVEWSENVSCHKTGEFLENERLCEVFWFENLTDHVKCEEKIIPRETLQQTTDICMYLAREQYTSLENFLNQIKKIKVWVYLKYNKQNSRVLRDSAPRLDFLKWEIWVSRLDWSRVKL